jgi:hypothetical protein
MDPGIILMGKPYNGPTQDELDAKQNMNALRNMIGSGQSIDSPEVVNAMMARDPKMGMELMANANTMQTSQASLQAKQQEAIAAELDRYIPVGAAIVKSGDQAAWDQLHMHLGQKYPEAVMGWPSNVAKGGEFLQAYMDARRNLKGGGGQAATRAVQTANGVYLVSPTGEYTPMLRDDGTQVMSLGIGTAQIGAQSREAVAGIGADVRRYGIDVGADTAAKNQAAQNDRQVAKARTDAGMKGVVGSVVVAPGQEPVPDQPGVASSVPEAKRRVALETSLPKARGVLNTTDAKLDDMTANIDALIKDPTLKNITGSEIAAAKGDWPTIFGTKSANAQQRVKQIIAQGGFNELADMRAASPTGGALGNVSDTEGQYLRAAFARLGQAQDYPSYVAALNELKAQIARSKQRLHSTFDETYAPLSTNGAAPPPPTAGAPAPAGGAAPLADPLGIR